MAAAQSASREGRRAPRIYVASLSDYNAGRLHGVWLEAVDIAEVRDGIATMLRASPGGHAEEYAIHDFEGFGSYLPSETEDVEMVCAVGGAVREHGTVFAAYLTHVGVPKNALGVAELAARFNDSYQGVFNSLEDWAEQYLEDSGALKDVPDLLRAYIDFESWAKDADLNGDIFTLDRHDGVHVFSHT